MNISLPSKVNIYISSNKNPTPKPIKPTTSTNIGISGTSLYLIKNNLLSEFKTDTEKAIARKNLGIVFNLDPDLFILDIGGYAKEQDAWRACGMRNVIQNKKIKIISYVVNDITYFITQDHYEFDLVLVVYQFRQDKDRTYFREIILSGVLLNVNDWEIAGYEEVQDTDNGTIVLLRENRLFNYPITITDAIFDIRNGVKTSLNTLLKLKEQEFDNKFESFTGRMEIISGKVEKSIKEYDDIFEELSTMQDDGTSDIQKIIANRAALLKIKNDLKTDYVKTVLVQEDDWDRIVEDEQLLRQFLITYRGYNVEVYEDSGIETPDISDVPENPNDIFNNEAQVINNSLIISEGYQIRSNTIFDFNLRIDNNTIFIE